MKISLWAIGKSHDDYVQKGVEDFTGRLQKYFTTDWYIFPVPKNAAALGEDGLKKKEADMLLAQIKKEDFVIVLDEFGKQLDSVQLANYIQQRANESVKRLVFIIGGAFGLHSSVMQRANFKWSLSPLTFPHQLVRLILAEQVYRACTILKNEKYHHK